MLKKVVVIFLLGLCSSALQAAPQLQSWVTSKGAKVIYVQAESLPMLDVRVVFDAGGARDGQLPGLANFVNNMLTEGTQDWDADVLATRVEDRGIRLGSGSLRDMAWLSIRTLTQPDALNVAIDTLGKVMTEPRFAEQDIERVRQQMLIGLKQSKQSPGSVAAKRLYSTLYADHPYAQPSDGTEQSLGKISPQDLSAFHRKYYVAANAVIAMVGDIDRQAAEALAERITADMQRGKAAAALPKVPEIKGGELRQSFPSSQSHIYVGQLGVDRLDPDYFPLFVGNHILGGSGLVSVLGEEVRNKRGLSYSVYSYFSPMRATGPFLMVAQTKNAQATDALDVMQQTLQDFIDKGPSQEQLDAAKRNIIGGFPLKVASNSKIVEYLAVIGFYDLPLNWLDTLPKKVEAVNLHKVRDAFQRHIDVQKNIVVIIGGS